jgi:hypothetical protein
VAAQRIANFFGFDLLISFVLLYVHKAQEDNDEAWIRHYLLGL